MQIKEIVVHTDGSSLNNPGPGGYAAVLMYKNHRKELYGGFRKTTNNRMELLGVIKALEALTERCNVTIHSDSKYVVNAFNKNWIYSWDKKGWITSSKQEVKNSDLWKRLLKLSKEHNINFVWVKGHDGNEENEFCDELCRNAARHNQLGVDLFYENSQ
jgi:ribonuclease HI